jgi:uncharacterized protein YjbJ (UPF0337 family)
LLLKNEREKGELTAFTAIVCAQYEDDVLDADDNDERPDNERENAVDVASVNDEPVLFLEALTEGVKRARADVSVNDTDRENGELCEPGAAYVSCGMISDFARSSELAGRSPNWKKRRKFKYHACQCKKCQAVAAYRLPFCVVPSSHPRRAAHHAIESGGVMDKDLNTRGTENQIKGKAHEIKGQVRGDLGDATDNTSEHLKGRLEEAKGKIQKNFGKAEKDADPDNV